MKSTLTLAALIAAALALGACSNAPHPAAASAFNPADPTTGRYPAQLGNIQILGTAFANGALGSTEFEVPVMVKSQPSWRVGVKQAFAFIHPRYTGTLKVTTKEGDVRVYVGEAAGGVDAPDLADGRATAQGVTLQRGWYRVDIRCLSEWCSNVVATFDGKPIPPYAVPGIFYSIPGTRTGASFLAH